MINAFDTDFNYLDKISQDLFMMPLETHSERLQRHFLFHASFAAKSEHCSTYPRRGDGFINRA